MIESGKYYQLKQPEYPAITGQGEMPSGLTIQKNGNVYVLPFGQVFKTTTQVDVANLDSGLQYPFISTKVVEELEEQFQLIEGE